MTVDQQCKNEILAIINMKLRVAKSLLGNEAKPMAMGMLQNFINTIPQNESDLCLADYLTVHPEVRTQYPQAVSSLPQSAYQYSMQELVECFIEISRFIK